ncbi:COG0792 Predicted endonuclease distantly related to archaeal Holliday junction resolvase [Oxalobacteraceae bacterium]|jgi:putative endonuclease
MATRHDFQRPSAVSLGRDAEARALAFLQQQGLTLIEKNFRCRAGEIDLIMHDVQTLVFIEVRSRKNQHFGGAAASVGPVKQQRLWRSASFYLLKFPKPPACRFDLVAIDGNDLRWMKNIRLSAR